MLKIRKKLAEKKEASKGIAKAGFTLIELLVVLAILAILVLLAAPRFLGYTKDANVSAMQADAKVLANAALVYNIDNEGWPGEFELEKDEAGELKKDANGKFIIKVEDGEKVPVAATSQAVANESVEGWVLDEAYFQDRVQSLSGKFSDYALLAEDATVAGVELQEGDVVFVGNDGAGVEDKDGDKHFAVNIEVPKADVTP